jgi:hypothetical protein
MKSVSAAFAALLLTTTVNAQTANLMCSGTISMYDNSGNVAPGATRVDLISMRISTPVGEFKLSRVDETQITFSDPTPPSYPGLIVFGYLDRTSGEMTVFWRTPEQEAKLKAGLPHKFTGYASLHCSAAKRLF